MARSWAYVAASLLRRVGTWLCPPMPISWQDICNLLEDMLDLSILSTAVFAFLCDNVEVGNATLQCRSAVKANPATGEYNRQMSVRLSIKSIAANGFRSSTRAPANGLYQRCTLHASTWPVGHVRLSLRIRTATRVGRTRDRLLLTAWKDTSAGSQPLVPIELYLMKAPSIPARFGKPNTAGCTVRRRLTVTSRHCLLTVTSSLAIALDCNCTQ